MIISIPSSLQNSLRQNTGGDDLHVTRKIVPCGKRRLLLESNRHGMVAQLPL